MFFLNWTKFEENLLIKFVFNLLELNVLNVGESRRIYLCGSKFTEEKPGRRLPPPPPSFPI